MAQAPDWGKGFAIGWKYGIIFMIAFFMLGYNWSLSIFLGVMALATTATIGAWYNPRDVDEATPEQAQAIKENQQMASPTASPPAKKKHFHKYGLTSPRQRRALRRFAWWFKRK